MHWPVNKKGYSLVEIIVTLGVFLVFAIGIYSSLQFIFKVVYNSRLRIIETGILNEQIEIIRNIPFNDVGIVNGSPSGVLERTVTTTRNGIDFEITRTIRNIDDAFDGTIGGSPNDTAPADYKLVELSVICVRCGQTDPIIISSYIGPKYLEGNQWNGALFISVYDSLAQPVQGATVRVWATSTSSTVDITDVTNNAGELNIVDLPEGVGEYHLTVHKAGYTADKTVTSSLQNPNPTKPPTSVIAQSVSSISFWIDLVSQINLSTQDSSCQPVGSVPVSFAGSKLLGTSPDIRMVSTTVSTDSSGLYTFSNLIWDTYGIRPTGYDLLGTIPPLPIAIAANTVQDVDLILGPQTANSLLVNVLDSVTGQPVANANVTVTSTSYNQSLQTGVGYIRQTDWSGGGNQLNMVDNTKYWSDDGGVENSSPAGDLKLRLVGQNYVPSAELESSIFDLGVSANLVNIDWQPLAQPPETGSTSLRFQVATSVTTTPTSWDYFGPDGTALTYYDQTTPVVSSVHDGDRYLRYKTYLTTDTVSTTPTLSDFTLTYTTSCTPPGQAYFGSLSATSYAVEVSKTGYQTKTSQVDVNGNLSMTVDLVSQ